MITAFIAIIIGIGRLSAAIITIRSTRDFLRSSAVVPRDVVALYAGGSHPQIAFVMQSDEAIAHPKSGMTCGITVGDAVQVRNGNEEAMPSARLGWGGRVHDSGRLAEWAASGRELDRAFIAIVKLKNDRASHGSFLLAATETIPCCAPASQTF